MGKSLNDLDIIEGSEYDRPEENYREISNQLSMKVDALEDQISRLKREKKELVESLKDIKNPLRKIQRDVPYEYKIVGHTVTSLLNSVEFYKDIARETLKRISEE